MYIAIGIIALLLYAALVFYIGWSGYRWLKPERSSARFKWLYGIVLLVVSSSFILGQFTRQPFLGVLGAYWMAVFYLLLLLVPLARLTVRLLRWTRMPHKPVHKWSGIAVLVLVIGLMGYGTFNAYSPVVRSYDIHIDKNVPGRSSMTVVMAADMHFGLLSGKDHAERLVEKINQLQPDLVLFPGDLVDDDIRPFVDQGLIDILSGIQATYGVYASLGNHDRFDGPVQDLLQVLEASGIDVLYDETILVADSIYLIGRKDYSDSTRVDLSTLMKGLDLSKPVMLLDHQPRHLDIAEEMGVDLMLSGHTHKGQVFPGSWITSALFENDGGYLKKNRLHSIVTSGYGFWGPPIRLGTRSEIVLLRISFGNNG